MHLQSLQDLNATVGAFFDEALYYLTRGYEAAAGAGAPEPRLPREPVWRTWVGS
jgi:hypothetical protein